LVPAGKMKSRERDRGRWSCLGGPMERSMGLGTAIEGTMGGADWQ
jgi:hypothetical protein